MEQLDDPGGNEPQLPSVFPLAGKNIMDVPPRLRFAPSPTGSLHVGGARTALYNWLLAKKGQMEFPKTESGFIIRVEDTDLARSTRESEQEVLGDLKWLGLIWDEGPSSGIPDISGYGPYRQSERNNIYKQAAEKLLQEGKVYRCFCTTEELEEMKAQQEADGIPPRYDGRWRDAPEEEINKMMDAGTPYTIRFKVPEGSRVVIDDAVRGTVAWDAEATVGDFILLRSNGIPVYNFCVAVDDALMGISTVVRAEEHLTNTVRQGLVLDSLGAPRPRYAHCSLILGEDKQKLSKRHGATSCNQFRLDGFLPDAMINYLALLGWNDGTDNEIFTRDELIDAFELHRVVKSPSVFDNEKLRWVNQQHMKMLSLEVLVELVKDQFVFEDLLVEGATASGLGLINMAFATTAIARERMQTTKDAVLNAKTVLGYALPATFDELTDADSKSMIEQGNFFNLAQRILKEYDAGEFPLPNVDNPMSAFQDAISAGSDKKNSTPCEFTQSYQAHMKQMAKEVGVKGKNLFHPVRLALTGEMSGQDVTKQLSLLTLATEKDSVIDAKKASIVPLSERMDRLRAFCESIPTEFRETESKESKAEKTKSADSSGSSETTSGGPLSSTTDPKNDYEGPPITALDIRVGKITKVWEHPEADKLYCEEIDVGEDEPRMVASGLKPYLKAEDMEGRLVLVLCNLKARKLVGFPSHGMVLCASNADHTDVRLVNPPIDAKIGERITVPDFDFDNGEESAPFAENKIGKKKVFEKIAPHLLTSKYGVPEFLGRPLMTSAGVCTSPISDGTVS
ncbi:glutamyl-tRNA synthetase [Fragilariopsis cylindrus CCMP1102]|uniref:glutamate--tRNA ligase n=1 Tax=Fragilariopsis cylindrus CCMP1102 TaxID=635003 RepID=A0A1E7FCZ5_9STRA|nr:glutamyl-tRNA synthetase [Fragilariopsis cylindrus CCMP1102]|eukprot:OEU16006.1 glutamyl-tRNA synthetase [Fragilariopsis cylindrus CCMP1102]